MLHYQISPPKKSTTKSTVSYDDESNRPTFLTLGAFATVPKIHFETVKLGEAKKKTLIIRNPCEQPIWLKFCKNPSDAFLLCSESGEPIIQPKGQYIIDITWTPTAEGQHFEAFQFQSSNTGIKFSVHLLGICIAPAVRKPNFRRRPLVSSQNTITPAIEFTDEVIISGHKNGVPIGRSSPNTLSLQNRQPSNITPPTAKSSNNCANDTSRKEEIIPPRTPSNCGLSGSDKLDAFAFPFTPECVSKNADPMNAANALRRETFLVENNEDEITPPSTPSNCGLSGSDKLDAFAFPFTPECVSKNADPINAVNAMRRETFLVEDIEEERLIGSPFAKITCPVENNLNNVKLDFVDSELNEILANLDATFNRAKNALSGWGKPI